MHSIRIRSRIGKDGLLQIALPEVMEGAELDIILVYEPAIENSIINRLNNSFYGCIQDDTFVRQPQGQQANREPIE
jgi:hypothetical protein